MRYENYVGRVNGMEFNKYLLILLQIQLKNLWEKEENSLRKSKLPNNLKMELQLIKLQKYSHHLITLDPSS